MDKNIQKIQNNKNILLCLSQCKDKLRKAIISQADSKIIETICDCVFNHLEGNIHLNEKEKYNLRKYKYTLRKLIKKSSLKE